MVAGLPKAPIERSQSIAQPAQCSAPDRIPHSGETSRLGTMITGFSLRDEARSMGT
jgi:hypothetical protein